MLSAFGTAAWLLFSASPVALALAGGVSADAGIEYDSNASRVGQDATPDPTTGLGGVRSGPLLRSILGGQLGYSSATQRLRLSLQAGGKVFLLPTLQDQNVGVILASYDHGAQLLPDGKLRLGGFVDYYDALQAPAALSESRDFRSLSFGARLTGVRPLDAAPQHRFDGGLDAGMQYFAFKPDSSFSFLAPSMTAHLNALLHAGDPELGHDFDVATHLRIDYRGYMFGRTDLFIQGGGGVTWQGPLLLQLGYMLQLALSNQQNESYQRHLATVKLAFRIPGDFYVTGKTQLNLLQGASGLFVPVSNIDDDNRSLALLDIERPLPRGFALTLRYTGYFSLPGEHSVDGAYQRHTAYLGFAYAYRTKRR